MRLLFVLFALATSLFSRANFANPQDVDPAVLKSFQATFMNAKEADWSVTESRYRVQFVLNGQYASAYYNIDGALIGVTRNITAQQLPIVLQAAVKKQYAKMWVTELFELSNDEGTQYYLTLEDGDTKVTLRSSSNINWMLYQKTKK